MGFTSTVVSDYNGIGWAESRQLVASSPEEVGALGVSAEMDVEAPSPHGYGKALGSPPWQAKATSSRGGWPTSR
jgi:hypothetical protein